MSNDTGNGGTPPQTPEALEADIERTRQELGETIEALVAKTDVKARVQHRATEVAGNPRSKGHIAVGRARGGVRSAREKAAEHGPAWQATRGVRVYSVAAAAVAGALLLAWLTVRRRRR
jgi:hypothetical protein